MSTIWGNILRTCTRPKAGTKVLWAIPHSSSSEYDVNRPVGLSAPTQSLRPGVGRGRLTVLYKNTDFFLNPDDVFLVQAIIADLVDELMVGDDNNLSLDQVELEEGAVDAGKTPEGLDGKAFIDLS